MVQGQPGSARMEARLHAVERELMRKNIIPASKNVRSAASAKAEFCGRFRYQEGNILKKEKQTSKNGAPWGRL